MAHNINTYIGRQAAWHALGTVTGNFLRWIDIQAQGGFDFLPEKRQLDWAGTPVAAWGIFRSDNGAFLGPVGEAYTPIDHAQGFRATLARAGNRCGTSTILTRPPSRPSAAT